MCIAGKYSLVYTQAISPLFVMLMFSAKMLNNRQTLFAPQFCWCFYSHGAAISPENITEQMRTEEPVSR